MKLYLMDTGEIIEFDEGDGSNLLPEDEEAGYVDYIYYTVYDIDDMTDVKEVDGGMILMCEPFKVRYKTADGIDWDAVAEDVVDFYCSGGNYVLL